MTIELDVLDIDSNKGEVVCVLKTKDREVKMLMSEINYYKLIVDGFFVGDGKEKDKKGVWNTSKEFERKE